MRNDQFFLQSQDGEHVIERRGIVVLYVQELDLAPHHRTFGIEDAV